MIAVMYVLHVYTVVMYGNCVLFKCIVAMDNGNGTLSSIFNGICIISPTPTHTECLLWKGTLTPVIQILYLMSPKQYVCT